MKAFLKAQRGEIEALSREAMSSFEQRLGDAVGKWVISAANRKTGIRKERDRLSPTPGNEKTP